VIEHSEILTRPRHARSAAGVLPRRRPGTTCRRSPPGTARPWRCHRLVAGFTDREDEAPAELPVIEHRQHGSDHGPPDRLPVRCRCAASPSTWHRLPAIATRYCSTLALSSPRGRLHQLRGQRPGRTAGDRVPPARIRPRQPRLASHPTPRPGHGPPDRQPVCRLAVALARLPAIATRYCSTLAPSSLRGRLHQLRGQRPGRTAGDRAPPALTRPRQPRLASPRPLTKPRPARSAAGVLPRLRPGPLAGDRLPVLLDPGAVIASWPASPIERTKPRPNCR
jgi:hypothetical protein